MRKKIKIALHWQILIAIAAAAAFGMYFPTNYKFTAKTYDEFKENNKKFNSFETKRLESLLLEDPLNEENFIQKSQSYTQKEFKSAQIQEITEYAEYNPALNWVEWMGIVFLRALKMIIIPLILSSVIAGIANIGSAGNLGRISLKTIIYYLSSSSLAIIGGLFFVNLINPGTGTDINFRQSVENLDLSSRSLGETLMNIVPENLFQALTEQDMLAIIFFAIMFGFFITRVPNRQKRLMSNFFDAVFEVMMKMTMFIIRFTPLGVFGIVAKTIADHAGKLMLLAESLGFYSLTVLAALAFHALIVLPLILFLIGRGNPYKHFKNMRTALLTAFSTSSSGATLSVTMQSVKNGSGVSNKVAGFTLPLGATVNMDGTALYEGIVALFIAQVYGIDLSLTEQLIVLITALLASIGAAGIPMAGIVMTSVVLSAVGLPLEGIGLILSVDKILDMFRTAVNVWSDSCGAVVVAKTEGEELNV